MVFDFDLLGLRIRKIKRRFFVGLFFRDADDREQLGLATASVSNSRLDLRIHVRCGDDLGIHSSVFPDVVQDREFGRNDRLYFSFNYAVPAPSLDHQFRHAGRLDCFRR